MIVRIKQSQILDKMQSHRLKMLMGHSKQVRRHSLPIFTRQRILRFLQNLRQYHNPSAHVRQGDYA